LKNRTRVVPLTVANEDDYVYAKKMVKLSVNVNKVAVVRNSRGGSVPSVLEAVEVCLNAGVRGITVHPRADQRHVTRNDVLDIAQRLAPLRDTVEFNIEGDPRPDWLELVHQVKPHQATLVPVAPGEVTSHAGWPENTPADQMKATVRKLREAGIRVSLFVDPRAEPIRWAKQMGADRVELYTEPYAEAFLRGGAEQERSYRQYLLVAELAHTLELGINAGHDLDLNNLVQFRHLPHLSEVSIGHALISRALFVGLETVVREYLALLGASA
jgi:pyridoxine 5-phosphate synthase